MKMSNNYMEKECARCAPKPFYKEPFYMVIAVLVFGFLLSYSVSFLQPLYQSFFEYGRMLWLPILIGLIIGGVIDYFVPQTYISKYFGQHKKKTIFYSVFFGFLMSACSHGILAIAMELYKKGASTPAVIAFLLASPWANLPITILLFGLFGVKALWFIVFAIIIAINTGLIYLVLDKKGMIECNHSLGVTWEEFSIKEDIKKRIKSYRFSFKSLPDSIKGIFVGSWSLTKMIVWWVLMGTFLASIARAYIPQALFQEYMGPTILGLLITLALAIVIEVCSEGSAPLAFEIFHQTKAFGNSFTFLMAGVATDYTEIGIIWKNIGRKTAMWLPIITVPQILLLGYLFNMFI